PMSSAFTSPKGQPTVRLYVSDWRTGNTTKPPDIAWRWVAVTRWAEEPNGGSGSVEAAAAGSVWRWREDAVVTIASAVPVQAQGFGSDALGAMVPLPSSR